MTDGTACEWCGRAIKRNAEGRWYAVKGEERGYDPLTCEATGQGHTSDRPEVTPNLGWWVVSGENLLAMLRRAHSGEDPDLIYAEEYANSEHERYGDG